MTDYREISQQYAQNGIKAAILINAGAAVALLSQVNVLIRYPFRACVVLAMLIWAAGVLCGALTGVLAFASTRYVDKSEREREFKEQHLRTSDTFMGYGVAAVLLSFACFLGGSVTLAFGIAWKLL